MSDTKKPEDLNEVLEQMKNDAELEVLKDEVALKKAKLDQSKYTQQLEQLIQDNADLELAKNLDFGKMTKEQILEHQIRIEEYIMAARRKMIFMLPDFNKMVPFFRNNLILLAAHTGRGKSTAAANIAYSVLKQKNEETGKGRRALIITNEEKSEDFYNRVIFLSQGWHYVNHDEITDEQMKFCQGAISGLASRGRLMIVDNDYGGAHGITTSIEGIESIFENLIANKEYYDVIIIDYYQNIIHSKKNPVLNEWLVQAKLARLLDQYKNRYPAPIILLAQCKQADEDDRTPFKERIAGRKLIVDSTTLAAEMTVDYKARATHWTFWKSRYVTAIGKTVTTGYNNGRFVPYDKAFQDQVAKDNAAIQEIKDKVINDHIDKELAKKNAIKTDVKEEKKSE
jgi:hypothetical protein